MCQQSAQARQSPQAAVQLNLASALALAGRHEECVAEYGALLQEEGGGASAALSQAHALRQVRVVWRLCDGGCGSPARCRSHEACGAVDTTGGTHVRSLIQTLPGALASPVRKVPVVPPKSAVR